MTVMVNSLTGAPPAHFGTWNSIDWNQAKREVRRLQMRIAKATREGRYGKVKSLQWLLTHSFYAKLLAVKRVTQNKGGKTPGIDGITWKSNKEKMQAAPGLKRREYRPQPLRRVYIPKKNGKQRPLGIPTMNCRAQQALYHMALEPVSEVLADKNAYGFRPKRSCADAIGQCFIIFARKCSARWVLEGDIKACFDKISHPWLRQHIPMDKVILGKWLECGYIDKGTFFPTVEGTPQGGIVSPTLLNLTLRGLEEKVASVTKSTDKINVVIYADDFIISGNSREVLEDKVKPAVIEFLKERGLTLSEEKTLITQIDSGFDFLGFNIRKYKDKLLIKPSRKSVKAFLADIRALIKKNPTAKTENLIRLLNPKIRGWANYFRHVVSQGTFDYVDSKIFEALMRWAIRRHPNRSKGWIWNKYFSHPNFAKGTLTAKVSHKDGQKILSIFRTSSVPIRRHVKIRAKAIPYDPAYQNYFDMRDRKIRVKGVVKQPCF